MTGLTVVFYAEAQPGVARIVSVFTGDEASVQAHADTAGLPWLALPGADPNHALVLFREHWVDLSGVEPAVAPCRPVAATWEPEAALLTGLPQPCTLQVLSDRHVVEDGEADLSALPPGDYVLTVQAVGFLTQTYAVTR